jgi:GT2 family glycosyltransferase
MNESTNGLPTALSIIIVSWNSAAYLSQCLISLRAQTFKDFETIIVDNGSMDGSIDELELKWPDLNLKVTRLKENLGFAAANNIGARLAGGRWLALLNTDAFPEPDWLERLLASAESNPEYSFFASRQLKANAPNFLDGAGDIYHISGLAWRRYAEFPAACFGLDFCEVFSACAAAAMYSREAFLQVGGFDEDFFSYHEDVDLSFRLRLQGFRCLYVPDAVVKHVGSVSVGAQSDFAFYHWQRNFTWSFIQNTPFALLWKALPAHLLANVIQLIYYIFRGRGAILWKAKMDALRGLSGALQKRKDIQKGCLVNPSKLLAVMEQGWSQPYLIGYNIRKIRQHSKIYAP